MKQFKIAYLNCLSRVFQVNANGIGLYMVPIADLFNHDSQRYNILWRFNKKTHNYEIYATSDINEGDEIINSYGRQMNSRLLLDYGFTDPTLIPPSPISYNPKKGPIKNPKKLGLTLYVDYSGGEIFGSLTNYRRLADEANKKKKQNYHHPISKKNELATMKLLEKVLQDKIRKYPTTLKHDKRRIKNKNISQNERNILNLLIEEKSMFYIALKNVLLVKDVLSQKRSITHSIKKMSKKKDARFKEYLKKLKNILS